MCLFASTAALAIIVTLGGASSLHAQNLACAGTVGGAAGLTTINGNVTVPNGASCTLAFAEVTGNVDVGSGGSLLSSAYDEPSTIGGSVKAVKYVSTLLEGNVTVKGDLRIENCTG